MTKEQDLLMQIFGDRSKLQREFERRLRDLPEPPPGYHYEMTEPEFTFEGLWSWSVQSEIVLKPDEQ